MITDERLREAWDLAKDVRDEGWLRKTTKLVERFATMPEAEFRRPEAQEELWRAKVGGIGPGSAFNLDEVYRDEQVVDRLQALRTTRHDDEAERDRWVVEQFKELVADLDARLLHKRPLALTLRVFSVLVPDRLTRCFSYKSYSAVSKLVLGRSKRGRYIEPHVEVRARLRRVLGPADSIVAHVRRLAFTWWLYQHAEDVGGDPPLSSVAPSVASTEPEDVDDDATTLAIWPFAKQRKGLLYKRTGLGLYQTILRETIEGAPRDELVESLSALAECQGWNASFLRSTVNDLLALGLIRREEGLLFPSDEGDALLEDDSADGFVERFLERVFGAAHVLRDFAREDGATSRVDVAERLMGLYTSWKSRAIPYELMRWSHDAGLLEPVGDPRSGEFVITDYGRGWASRLPDPLPEPPDEIRTCVYDEPTEDSAARPDLTTMPTLEKIHARFGEDQSLAEYVFEPRQIAALHAAWNASPRKRFVLLSGLSGTGKTAITHCYAKAVCDLLDIDLNEHYENVAVSPDWMDPSGLLGYLNSLHQQATYRTEPALRLVQRASELTDKPFFLVLDEMNLARVERYFAPFLSAMETGGDLVLHAEEQDVSLVPPRIPWPRNLFIAGTVNMDESTHAFSDKVLDRAFTLEFWDVDLERYFERHKLARDPSPAVRRAMSVLVELFKPLYTIRRHFGYRTAGEVLAFVNAGADTELTTASEMLDQAVFSKILPRLRGDSQPALSKAMQDLETICRDHDLAQCETKLTSMRAQLEHTGVMKFWS